MNHLAKMPRSSCFSRLQFLLVASWLLLVVALFQSTFACVPNDRLRHRHHHPNQKRNIHDKRNVDNAEYNEVGIDNESPMTSCGKVLCPKVENYPSDEIKLLIDGVHNSNDDFLAAFPVIAANLEKFYTSERSKTIARRPHDHWFFKDHPGGCTNHARVQFPQQAYSNGQHYYVVNVPGLQQSLVENTCAEIGKICSKDSKSWDTVEPQNKRCRQNYGEIQLVVLPMNKKGDFEYADFKVKSFIVSESCVCRALV